MNKKGILISFIVLCILSLITLLANFYVSNHVLILTVVLVILISMLITLIIDCLSNENYTYKNSSYKNQMNELLKNTKELNIESKIIKIVEDYILRNDTDKFLLEKYLKDCIVNIDKTTFASIFLTFIPVAISILIKKNDISITEILVVFGFIMAAFIVLAFYICRWINQYRFYKQYLGIIDDLDNNKIRIFKENGVEKLKIDKNNDFNIHLE